MEEQAEISEGVRQKIGVPQDYAARPVEFARDVLRGEPWSTQEEILEAVRDHSRVTVRSCHGVGKTWVAAAASLWFLYTRNSAIVLSTAPTHRQVKEVLWRELRRQHRTMFADNGPLAGAAAWVKGELRETALRLADDHYALGLTTDEPDRFQGFHSAHALVVVDEASGVDEEIFNAIDGVLTGEEARLLLIGNPLHTRGRFYDSHRRDEWRRFAISAFDCPNVKGRDLDEPESREAKAVVPGLVTARWVWERRQDWGEESPLYQARVLGQFPDQATDALISMAWIQKAIERGREAAPPSDAPIEAGVDVARFGNCESVLCIRRGERVLTLQAWRAADLLLTAERVSAACREYGVAVARVDGVGMGAGVVDLLRRSLTCTVLDVNGGRAAQDPENFTMLRDELFFGLRARFEHGHIAIPDDQRLHDQLAALTYRVTPRGQSVVVSKDELASRGTASPDRADALALAFAALGGRRPIIAVGRAR